MYENFHELSDTNRAREKIRGAAGKLLMLLLPG